MRKYERHTYRNKHKQRNAAYCTDIKISALDRKEERRKIYDMRRGECDGSSNKALDGKMLCYRFVVHENNVAER